MTGRSRLQNPRMHTNVKKCASRTFWHCFEVLGFAICPSGPVICLHTWGAILGILVVSQLAGPVWGMHLLAPGASVAGPLSSIPLPWHSAGAFNTWLSRAPGAGQTSKTHPQKSGQTAFRYPDLKNAPQKQRPNCPRVPSITGTRASGAGAGPALRPQVGPSSDRAVRPPCCGSLGTSFNTMGFTKF
jgi:hypothetical protein